MPYSVHKGDKGSDGYSEQLKKMHMTEGAKLAENILKSLSFPDSAIEQIVDIVSNHEDLFGFPPSDIANTNKVIVSDADKLFRLTPFNFVDIIKIHGASQGEAFRYLLDMKDKWLVTRTARQIAEEEIRKIPESHLYSKLFV